MNNGPGDLLGRCRYLRTGITLQAALVLQRGPVLLHEKWLRTNRDVPEATVLLEQRAVGVGAFVGVLLTVHIVPTEEVGRNQHRHRIGSSFFGLVGNGAYGSIRPRIAIGAVVQHADKSVVRGMFAGKIGVVWHCRDLHDLTITAEIRRMPCAVLQVIRIEAAAEVHTGAGEDHVERIRVVLQRPTGKAIFDQLYHLTRLHYLARLWRTRTVGGPRSE